MRDGRPGKIGRGGIFFVPQRPYIPQGSLRVQLLYPMALNSDDFDEGIQAADNSGCHGRPSRQAVHDSTRRSTSADSALLPGDSELEVTILMRSSCQ